MKKQTISRIWLGLSLFFALLAITLVLFPSRSPLLLFAKGHPEDAANAFFGALEEGDYSGASAYCSPALPAENYPEEEDEALVYAALRSSWHWTPSANAVRKRNHATITGQLRVLDLAALSEGLNEDVNAALAERVSNARLGSEIYNEDGSYRDEAVTEVWLSVLSKRLETPESYYHTTELTVELVYRNGQWFVQTDEALMRALSGGAA